MPASVHLPGPPLLGAPPLMTGPHHLGDWYTLGYLSLGLVGGGRGESLQVACLGTYQLC